MRFSTQMMYQQNMRGITSSQCGMDEVWRTDVDG